MSKDDGIRDSQITGSWGEDQWKGRPSLVERNSDPRHFELIVCSAPGCNSRENLLMHRYSDEHMCEICVNNLVAEIKREEMIAEEKANGLDYQERDE